MPVHAHVLVRKEPHGVQQVLDLDLGQVRWLGGTAFGAADLDRRALDFLEIARVVWEVERHMPKRISSERVRKVELAMPLRESRAWTAEAKTALAGMLRLLGNAEWVFDFKPRSERTTLDSLIQPNTGGQVRCETVSLFSGGLDSTCGLAWLKREKSDAVLASFYGAKAKQAQIAAELGVKRHVQIGCIWDNGRRRFGGQFQYRSLLFLALGAVVAQACEAKTLMQFENGPLAIASPPSRMYRMTRHAHPKLHRLAEELFRELFGRDLEVQNPFLIRTKHEMAVDLRHELGKDRFASVVRQTETCWNLTSRQVVGTITKKPGTPCGVCAPCVVRRTALRGEDVAHAVDLTNPKDPHFGDENARVHVDAYRGWASKIIDSNYNAGRFSFEGFEVLRDAVHNSQGVVDMNGAYELYRRFAGEIIDTFP